MNVAYVSNVGHHRYRALIYFNDAAVEIMINYCTAPFRLVLYDALEYVCMTVNYSSITLSVPLRVWATPDYEAASPSLRASSLKPALLKELGPLIVSCFHTLIKLIQRSLA